MRAAVLGDLHGGGGEGGGRARRAGRGGERAPAEAAVLIPAAKRSSARRASQMACPALGLEALQPLQPEPPPEPAFTEAQKWIEVGADGDGRPYRGAPSYSPGPAPPNFHGQLSQVTHRGLQRTAVPWRWSPRVVGVNGGGGHCGLAVRPGAGGGPLRLHPGSQSRLGFASAAMGSAVRAEALQTRQGLELPEPLWEPHFRVSSSLLHISPLGLPPRPSGAEFGSVSTEAHTHRRASWLCSGTGSGARLAQSIA